MEKDETAIRDLIAKWMQATAAGDAATICTLMADDVVFLIPGQPPMRGKDQFMANFERALQQVRIEAKSNVQEIQVSGDIAYCWNELVVSMTPRQSGSPFRHSGYVLTILRKQAAGNWVVFRDANLLTPEPLS